MRRPELLSPAGTLKNMRYAFAYGADAVYAGQPRYSLRVRNNDFSLENLAVGVAEAHQQGKKFYVASNLMPHNAKVRTYMADMAPVIALKPDALIMADPGLIMMVREAWPQMPIHLSVQASTVNFAAVKFWRSIGIERVILSRELSLDEIEEIKQQCPEVELEVFVHGALCIAYSGRCLLSGYFNHRDPNQGACTNSCRWDYKLHATVDDDAGDVRLARPKPPVSVQPSTQAYLLEEAQRPGQYMPIYEDELGTYIMNSKDLRAVQHVERLARIGIDSLKIEGRTKSHYYVARTAQVYRRAIDEAVAGRPFDMGLLAELDGLANRGYTEGFFRRHVPQELQNYESSRSDSETQRFVGEVVSVDGATQVAQIDVKNKFAVGDTLELLSPTGNTFFVLERMETMDGLPLQEAPGGGHQVRVGLPTRHADMALLLRKNPPQAALGAGVLSSSVLVRSG